MSWLGASVGRSAALFVPPDDSLYQSRTEPEIGSPSLLAEAIVSRWNARVCHGSVKKVLQKARSVLDPTGRAG
jgi:hypothetical protein